MTDERLRVVLETDCRGQASGAGETVGEIQQTNGKDPLEREG